MQAQSYDFTLQASGSVRLDVVGTSFKLLSSGGPVQVIANTGARVMLMPGQGIRRFEFDSLTIINKSGAVNIGQILITGSDDKSAEMIDDRITGEVMVIDGAKQRVSAGNGFLHTRTLGAPSPGNNWIVELWNQGTGKSLVVENITVFSSSSRGFVVGSGETPQYSFAKVAGKSKMIGASDSTAGFLAALDAAPNQSGELVSSYSFFVNKLETKSFDFKTPFLVLPGKSIRVYSMDADASVSVGFQWFEDLI